METKLRWKKGLFSNRYVLMQDDMLVGELISKSFSQSSYGELNGKKYQFITSGFFKQSTEIIDTKTNQIVGKITYSTWSSKASIALNDETLYWKQVSIWKSKWEISNSTSKLYQLCFKIIDKEILKLQWLMPILYHFKIKNFGIMPM
ncbi:MAG: hypothetical protein PF448_11850 [Bacteroidales bacterium]|jgi:hypothetical protein|nr:hypothetical protein [Bacteroidales bacterium]